MRLVDGINRRPRAGRAAIAGLLAVATALLALVPMEIAAAPAGASRTTAGYWELAADGGIFAFGSAVFHGSMGGAHLNAPIVGMAADRVTGGYWEVAADGGIFSFDAPFYGSMGGRHLNAPIVGMAPTPTGGGYWEVASDGGVFTFGDAHFYGSMGGTHLNAPIVGMAATFTGKGYWLVGRDGGVFTFGKALFHGSCAGTAAERSHWVGITSSGTPGFYRLAASNGDVAGWTPDSGAACTGEGSLHITIVGFSIAPNANCQLSIANGWWFVASNGAIFSTTGGCSATYGTMASQHLNAPIVGIAAAPYG
jgi:hypothetical protein